MPSVGFIGLGEQGGPMARRLIESGVQTVLWARRKVSLEPFADLRPATANTPADLAGLVDIVCVCVVDDSGVEAIVAGDGGILSGMRPGGIVAIHSTVHPHTCTRLAGAAAERGITLIDAPVSGGGAAAASGTLLVIVGGPDVAVARCRPVFEVYGDPVSHVGPLGSAQIAKLLNNLLMAAHLGLAEQALDAGVRLGLDRKVLAGVLQRGSGRSYSLELLAVFGSSDPFKASAGPLLRKDVTILDGLLHDAGVDAEEAIALAENALRRMG